MYLEHPERYVVDATAKFLKAIKLTTQARAILTGCLEFTYIFKVCWTNIFALQFKSTCADFHVTPLNFSYSETPADVLKCANLKKPKEPIVSLVANLNNKNNVCKKLFLLYKST